MIRVLNERSVLYRSIPKPTIPPPGQTPGHLTFLKNFGQIARYVVSLDGQMPPPPPVRALNRVKSPTLQKKQNRLPLEINRIAYLWKKFCKIFSHYEFLVQLAFAPRFKQRHIPRYNYIKRQHQKRAAVEPTRAMTRERGSRAEAKNCESFCFRPLTDVLTRKSNAPLYGA